MLSLLVGEIGQSWVLRPLDRQLKRQAFHKTKKQPKKFSPNPCGVAHVPHVPLETWSGGASTLVTQTEMQSSDMAPVQGLSQLRGWGSSAGGGRGAERRWGEPVASDFVDQGSAIAASHLDANL